MATIQTAFKLTDGMTRPLQNITSAMNIVINTMESMEATSSNAIDTSALTEARERIAQVTAEWEQMEQNIGQTGAAQEDFKQNIENTSSAADALGNKLKGILATVVSIAGVKMGLNWAKENMELADIQRNAENQLAAVLGNMGGTQADYQAILDKATSIQGAGIYGDESMIAGAAELATYFSDADAIMSMMDTLSNYAMGMTGGGALDTTAMTDYATNIGKIMTGSYDAMTKKGFEFTDAQKAILEGTATQAQYIEALGADYASLSEDMRAATVINSVIAESWDGLYETMSNTPEGKIIQFNNKLGDLRETLGNQIYPYVLKVYDGFTQNFPQIEMVLTNLTTLLGNIVLILGSLMEGALNIATVISDNWSWIAPLVMGIVGAFLAYNAALVAYNAIKAISAGVEAIHAAHIAMSTVATGAETTATFAATAAQYGFNAALLACPIFWIVAGVIALIAAITAVVRALDVFGAKSHSVFGTLTGLINVAIQFFVNLGLTVANIALGIWNALGACCTNIGVAFHNVIANVQGWFYGLLSTALTVVEGICAALNKLPFVEFDYSGITAKANEYAAKSAEAYGSTQDYVSISDAFSKGFSTFDAFSSGWAQDAFDAGAKWGDSVSDKVSGIFDTSAYDIGGMDAFNLSNTIGDIADSSANTAGNTAALADALDRTEEDIKYLLDMAEREAINRYTTAEITVEQHNENHIEKDADVDGIMDAWAADFAEKLDISGEGAY